MKLIHGTTYNRLKSMLEVGYIGSQKTVWTASEKETTYFYTESFLREERGCPETCEQCESCSCGGNEWMNEGLRNAMQSAEIALSQERDNLKRVVLVFDTDDLEKIGEVEDDYSCGETMAHCKQFTGRIPVTMIKEVYIDEERLDLFAMFFIGFAQDRMNDSNKNYGRYNMPTVKYYRRESETRMLSDSMLNACAQVYIELCEWWFEEMYDLDRLKEYNITEVTT